MSYGFRVVNTANTVQVDERFANLALSASGTVYVSGAYDLTVSGVTPLVAIVPTGNSSGRLSITRGRSNGDGTFTFRLFTSWFGLDVDYFVFDKPATLGSGYGLRVFDASGNVTFDSRLKYMRVQELIIDQTSNGDGMDWSRTFTSGRRYAVVTTLWNIYAESSQWVDDEIPGIPQYYWSFQTYHYAVDWTSAHQLSATWQPYQSGSGGPDPSPISGLPSGSYGPNGRMIIDVTNF